MKTLSILLALCISWGLAAQAPHDALTSIGKGDVEGIAPHLADDVELCFYNNPDLYTKEEALEQLTDFFSKHQAQGVTIDHTGAQRKDGSDYMIATLKTDQGPIRVFVYSEKVEGARKIQEIRFTSEE